MKIYMIDYFCSKFVGKQGLLYIYTVFHKESAAPQDALFGLGSNPKPSSLELWAWPLKNLELNFSLRYLVHCNFFNMLIRMSFNDEINNSYSFNTST